MFLQMKLNLYINVKLLLIRMMIVTYLMHMVGVSPKRRTLDSTILDTN